MNHNLYGYIRVSTQEQNEERQIIALKDFDIPPKNLYLDKLSGKNFNRPAYRKLMKRLGQGDLLIIKAIDRLGRDYMETIEQWRLITRVKKADIRVLDMPLLDTTYHKDLLGTFISDLVLQVLSFTAQSERELLRQRQAEGIAAAKARGTVFGKIPIPLPEDFDSIFRRWHDKELSSKQAAALCGCSVRTFYEKTRTLRNHADTL